MVKLWGAKGISIEMGRWVAIWSTGSWVHVASYYMPLFYAGSCVPAGSWHPPGICAFSFLFLISLSPPPYSFVVPAIANRCDELESRQFGAGCWAGEGGGGSRPACGGTPSS